MINRRGFVGFAVGAGATIALTPELLRAFERAGGMPEMLRALQQGELMQRAIPSTGEMLPVVGLSLSNHVACADPAALKEVLRAFAENGGRVLDSLYSNAAAEEFHARTANELGIQHKLFWTTRATPGAGIFGPGKLRDGAVKKQIDRWSEWLNAPTIDLVMLGPNADPKYFTELQEAKSAGRVRYIGSSTISEHVHAELEAVMRDGDLDFIGVRYDVDYRKAEERLLPLALERKIGVMALLPLGSNAGASCSSGTRNLFARVGDRPLPEWAAEFDAKTWAQFFLKYVISHPAVAVARVGTTKVHHMVDNIGAGIGRLPDAATRKRMAELIDSIPPLPPLQKRQRFGPRSQAAATLGVAALGTLAARRLVRRHKKEVPE